MTETEPSAPKKRRSIREGVAKQNVTLRLPREVWEKFQVAAHAEDRSAVGHLVHLMKRSIVEYERRPQ